MKRRSRAGGKASKGEVARRQSQSAAMRQSRARHSSTRGTEVARLTRELHEAPEQQAATSEVFRSSASSAGDLQPVFAAILENAVRICDAKFGTIYRCDGDVFPLAHIIRQQLCRSQRSTVPGPHAPTGRMMATKTVVHIPDLAAGIH